MAQGTGSWQMLVFGISVFSAFSYTHMLVRLTILIIVLALTVYIYFHPFKPIAYGISVMDGLALSGFVTLGVFSPHLQLLLYALVGLCFLGLWKGLRTFIAMLVFVIIGMGIAAEGWLPPMWYTITHSKRATSSGFIVSLLQSWGW